MKIIVSIMFIFLAGCAMFKIPGPTTDDVNKRLWGNAARVTELHGQQRRAIVEGADESAVVWPVTESAIHISDLHSFCPQLQYRGVGYGSMAYTAAYTSIQAYSSCMDTYAKAVSEQAEMMLALGDYYLARGKVEKAKETYRNVILTYTGDIYRTYVKRAEFALEDMKGE